MKTKLLAALLTTSMLVSPAIVLAKEATTSKTATVMSQNSNANYERMMKVSDEGYSTWRNIRAARLAIFDGNPEAAQDKVKTATDELGKARKDAANFYGRKNAGKEENEWIPIDGSLDIVDDFVPSDQKKEHIAKANQDFRDGKKQEAVEQLKLGEVDVNFTRFMMPLTATEDHLKVAGGLLNEKKYYEANLALKAAEDGLVIDTVALVEVPKDTTRTAVKEDDKKSVN